MDYKKRLVRIGDIFPNGVFFVNENNPIKSLDELIERIHKAPTLDAVEVVRCKDCKHYKPHNRSAKWHCKALYCCRITVMKTNPDDFCSYGERRTDV